jgi:hypothetical protein
MTESSICRAPQRPNAFLDHFVQDFFRATKLRLTILYPPLSILFGAALPRRVSALQTAGLRPAADGGISAVTRLTLAGGSYDFSLPGGRPISDY